MFPRKLFSYLQTKQPGAAPGTLVHVGEKHDHEPTISILDYDSQQVREEVVDVSECAKYKDQDTVTWVNVDAIHDAQLIQDVGERFGLHPLILEDVLNANQRSKLEEYADQIFVVLRMIWLDEDNKMRSEQVSFVLSDKFVICFQERPGDIFDPVRERIRTVSARIRKRKSDYLLYALLDTLVDHYFLVLGELGAVIERIEEQLMESDSQSLIQEIYSLKRELMYVQRYVLPLREVTNHMLRAEHVAFEEETLLFVRDLHDHVVQAIETVQLSREMVNGLIDLSMNQASNRMNEVMKVLTIIATIFIPLTFVAGIYGMNFAYMPELSWRYGYFFALGLMAVMTVGMVFYFKKKQWL